MDRPTTEARGEVAFCGIVVRCSASAGSTLRSVGTDIGNSGPLTGAVLMVGAGSNSAELMTGVLGLLLGIGRHELATTTPPAYWESAGRNAGEVVLTATTCRTGPGSSATARGRIICTGGGAISDR